MQNEQIERYLLDLLMRLSAEEGEGVAEDLFAGAGPEGFLDEPDRKGWNRGRGRRFLRDEERLGLELPVEGVLIELQEMGVLSPSDTERFLEKIKGLDCETITPLEAVRLASSILRGGHSGGSPNSSLMLEHLVEDRTFH